MNTNLFTLFNLAETNNVVRINDRYHTAYFCLNGNIGCACKFRGRRHAHSEIYGAFIGWVEIQELDRVWFIFESQLRSFDHSDQTFSFDYYNEHTQNMAVWKLQFLP